MITIKIILQPLLWDPQEEVSNTTVAEKHSDNIQVQGDVDPHIDNEEVIEPIVHLASDECHKRTFIKNPNKMVILQLSQLRTFLKRMRCGRAMAGKTLTCSARLLIKREIPLDHPGVRMRIQCARGHLHGL